MVSEIPPFDVALGYELYTLLLKPVEAAWQPAKSSIVATNGAQGECRSVLCRPRRRRAIPPQPLFANYRKVAWLARRRRAFGFDDRHVAAVAARLAARDKLIGFGDPYFNADQAAEAERERAAPLVVASATGAEAENVTPAFRCGCAPRRIPKKTISHTAATARHPF